MNETPRARLVAYGVAVLAPAVSLLVRWLLWPLMGDAVPHMTFFPAVMIAAYFGGFWPGLLATGLSAVAANYFFTQQLRSFRVTNVNDAAALVLFLLVGVIISGLCEFLHRARRRIVAEECRRAEEALVQERYLLHALMDNLPDNIYFKDAAGRFLRINKALTTYFGLSNPAQALGKTDFDFFTKEHAGPAYADEQEIIRTGQPVVGKEEKETWLDGRVRWVSTTRMPFRDKDGAIIGTFGVARDITKLKLAEEALRESEQRWRNLTEMLPQLVWTATPEGGMDYSSAQVGQYMGRPESELLGWGWLEMLHPDDRERTRQAWRAAVEEQSEYEIEHRFRRFDGAYRWFKTRGVAIRDCVDKVYKWFGTCTDITTAKQLEEELLQANERLNLAVRGSNLAIWEVDMPDGLVENGRVTLINAWESLGYNPAEAPSDFAGVFVLAVHPEDRDRVGRAVQACLNSETREFDVEYRVPHQDGSNRWHLTRGTVLRDPKGRPIRFIGSRVDITDLKRAEEALRASEQRFRTFVDHATDAFFLQDDHGVILDVNRQACASLGYTREELVGKRPPAFDPDLTPALIEELHRQTNSGQTVAFESRHRRKDGTLFPVEVRGRAFWEGGRRFLVSLARDVSERKQDEALLIGQKRILELIIQGEPLPHVLTDLCRTIEELAQGEMLAAILLLDADGVHLRHGAAPSLPESYVQALDGLAIGPSVRSCGTAAYRREPVYVSDIASDPLWASCAELALSHGLRACWSSPILSRSGEVLGTFGMYYRQPRRPNPRDLRPWTSSRARSRLPSRRVAPNRRCGRASSGGGGLPRRCRSWSGRRARRRLRLLQ